ncbi:S-adenosyl-L-methionine-dependent methyltransferase [Parathielavia appendiculata]|uniref:S-adenosyl-L-methionine-dependent methyltransferase n=1 Tax=Parathielavia appendiculata TaxID=2587402 RepID=A0AAN6Z127_9PEZI|nr:S-adenosyl-L-methionine-dependent methyltransferase [Parathielavia appendiculata]
MTATHNSYAPGHDASQTKHHEWRTAENSAVHLLPHLARLAPHTPHLKLLDVGAGSGTITASLAKYLPPGGRITATDISDDILLRARNHAATQSLGTDKITFLKASVYHLPFQDGEFDVVHAHQVLSHLGAPVDAIREMFRVCRPGGGGVVSLRETDMAMWCFWPETPALQEGFRGLMARTLTANGGQDRAGRRLVSWALAAGVPRGQIEAGFGTWCYSEPGDQRAWGEAMIERLKTGQMRSKGIEMGITTEQEIEDMIKAWREWVETEDATLGIMNGEVIIKKGS